MCLYIILSFLALYMFGSFLKSDVLQDVDEERGQWESYVLRAVFLVVLACHIPFIFFSGKEAALIIIDEVDRKSTSEELQAKFERLKQQSGSFRQASQKAGEEEADPAYLDMRPWLYYLGTLLIYAVEITGAIFIKDISTIFGFVSAFAGSCIAFGFSGAFFLSAMKKFGTEEDRKELRKDIVGGWAMLVLGIVSFVFFNVGNVLALIPSN